MKATNIKLVDMTPRWGLVSVMAEDTSIVREYRITGEEVAAVLAGGIPPGCTDEEWASGRVLVAGRPCLPGMCVKNPDGWLVVNFGIGEEAGKTMVSIMRIPPNEWTLIDDVVHIDEAVAASMGY